MSRDPLPDPRDLDPVAMANRRAKGRRPAFFADPAVDRAVSIAMALAGELAVTRERLDTLERVLVARGALGPDDIERFEPDAAAQAARHELGRAYVARVLRILDQDVQALQAADDPTMDAVADELGRGEQAAR